jgi:hypothetical protein
MADFLVKLHSTKAWNRGQILIFCTLDQRGCVAITLEDGLSQEAVMQKIQNGFRTLNEGLAQDEAYARIACG